MPPTASTARTWARAAATQSLKSRSPPPMGETRQVYTVTVHRSEKAASTGGAGTGSGSSGGGSASQSSGDGDSDTSSGGTEASPERESTEETVPVAGGVGESSSPGGGEGDASPEGSASGGLVFQNGETSRLPALLVLVAFILFCFLSGPLAKMLAKRFPKRRSPPENNRKKEALSLWTTPFLSGVFLLGPAQALLHPHVFAQKFQLAIVACHPGGEPLGIPLLQLF